MPATRRPTQADVARLAGVAQCTVSQVLNETDERPARVSPATRGRIQEAARVLAYPAEVRRPRRQQRDVLIGLVAPVSGNEVDGVVRRGVEREATLLGCDLVIYTASTLTRPVRRSVDVDGCIVIGPASDPRETDCPVVRIHPEVLATKASGQANRAYAVGRSAVRQLIATL